MQRGDVELSTANEIEQTPVRVAWINELAKNLPAVQHDFGIGKRQRDGHAAHQYEPAALSKAAQRGKRQVRVAGVADHVKRDVRATVRRCAYRLSIGGYVAGRRPVDQTSAP